MSKARFWMLTVVLAAGVSACGGSKKEEPAADKSEVNVVRPGAPGQPSQKVPEDQLKDPETVKAIAQDVEFMRGMIHHHQQALVMTGWVPQRTQSTAVRLMAERMAISQQGEIEQYERWLSERGFDAGGHGHESGDLMPGMLTQPQLDRLQGASGKGFDRLFLEYMTQHHRGAITMVEELQSEGGGTEADIGNFARHIETDQELEISRMQKVLAELH